jgi:hypothetical protein
MAPCPLQDSSTHDLNLSEAEIQMSPVTNHLSRAELEAGLLKILESPQDAGELVLVVQRPASGQRNEVSVGKLSVEKGLVGDPVVVASRGKARQNRNRACY